VSGLIRRLSFACILLVFSGTLGAAMAQQSVWVQIEAKPNLHEAQQTAQAYSRSLQLVSGYVLRSGWFAIALGPFSPIEAEEVLLQMRITRQIPADSYIVDGGNFRRKFWPDANVVPSAVAPLPQADAQQVVAPPPEAGEETVAEARRSERRLSREEREVIQSALQWEGFYRSAIDASFGRGTRNAMAAWQLQEGYEATGVLTTNQRRDLMARYREVLASVQMARVIDTVAGIEIDLPAGMVEFDRYQPPFAQYAPRGDSGVRVLLISQTGDGATLRSLYDVMQTLEIVPLDGRRAIKRRSFTLTAEDADISSYTYAALSDGYVKGFTVIWPAGADRRRDLVISMMKSSFRTIPDVVLADAYGGSGAAQSVDLLAGLSIRQPDVARSGFYVDASGAVLTTADAVASCKRVTLDQIHDAEVAALDAPLGLALLRPQEALSPIAVARLLAGTPRINAEIAVSGYSYGGILGAPSLTYGRLADTRGLDGEASVNRLVLAATQSDAGGPVFDTSGAVTGMLLSPDQTGNRRLPDGVSFAADASAIAEFLARQGISPGQADGAEAMAPEDLILAAAEMTVLVSCWN
jgi:peptidoglycan hydrolase-like protein with peptidoglycan-binding domain